MSPPTVPPNLPPTFESLFNAAPMQQGVAPGRVTVLGEHTDYSEGFVLPTVIPQHTTVQLGLSSAQVFHFYSQTLDQAVQVEIAADPPPGFGRYLWGCIRCLERLGHSVPPLNVYVTSTIPVGVGLSSSAALEIALLRGLRSLFSLPLTDLELAQLGQRAEREYAGVQCGILDQMAVTFAAPNTLLFLDTRTLDHQPVPLPEGSEILVLDSGLPRTLATSGYNQRRAECEAAAAQLGVSALRDIQTLQQLERLPKPLRQRATHVLTENQRVLAARSGVSAQQLGALMNASHASLRDTFAVSVPGVDCLAALLQETPGVFGAKLTGAGFGGACVALVKRGQAIAIAQTVLERYGRAGYRGRLLVPAPTSTG